MDLSQIINGVNAFTKGVFERVLSIVLVLYFINLAVPTVLAQIVAYISQSLSTAASNFPNIKAIDAAIGYSNRENIVLTSFLVLFIVSIQYLHLILFAFGKLIPIRIYYNTYPAISGQIDEVETAWKHYAADLSFKDFVKIFHYKVNKSIPPRHSWWRSGFEILKSYAGISITIAFITPWFTYVNWGMLTAFGIVSIVGTIGFFFIESRSFAAEINGKVYETTCEYLDKSSGPKQFQAEKMLLEAEEYKEALDRAVRLRFVRYGTFDIAVPYVFSGRDTFRKIFWSLARRFSRRKEDAWN